jgi:hypothetical protein
MPFLFHYERRVRDAHQALNILSMHNSSPSDHPCSGVPRGAYRGTLALRHVHIPASTNGSNNRGRTVR